MKLIILIGRITFTYLCNSAGEVLITSLKDACIIGRWFEVQVKDSTNKTMILRCKQVVKRLCKAKGAFPEELVHT